MKMEREPFDLIALREQDHRKSAERKARLRSVTVEPEEKAITPQEEARLKLEQIKTALSEIHPGSPSAVSAVQRCLTDAVDVLSFCLDALDITHKEGTR